MNEDLDIWQKAFGGKDTLRLSIEAHSFRIRRTMHGETASFGYGDGMRVSIRYISYGFFKIRLHSQSEGYGSSQWVQSCNEIRGAVEDLTGLVLNCFE
jgi:hypothetical protein